MSRSLSISISGSEESCSGSVWISEAGQDPVSRSFSGPVDSVLSHASAFIHEGQTTNEVAALAVDTSSSDAAQASPEPSSGAPTDTSAAPAAADPAAADAPASDTPADASASPAADSASAAPAQPAGLTEGRIAHYVAYNERHLAAIVTGAGDVPASADLVVFTNMKNVAGHKNGGVQFHFDVSYSEGKEPGTWHYPERV